MAQNASTFDYSTGDLEEFVRHVTGLNLVYRGRILKAIRSEDNEMVKVAEIVAEIRKREAKEGVRLWNHEFEAGFVTLFNMNGGKL